MRSTTIVSLVVSWALISQSPAAYAAPIPSRVDSVGGKRCIGDGCKFTEPPDTTSQSEVQNLVDVLINALQTFQPPNSNTTV
ncbi:hypothetical protein V8E52_000910 [Russula decolorans]